MNNLTLSFALPRFCKQDGVDLNVRSVIAQLSSADLFSIIDGGPCCIMQRQQRAIMRHATCFFIDHGNLDVERGCWLQRMGMTGPASGM